MAHSIDFLLSADAAQQRMVARKPLVVVHVELHGKGFEELDAESVENGADIAMAWLRHSIGGTITAAVREVRKDGTLKQPVRLFDFRDVEELV